MCFKIIISRRWVRLWNYNWRVVLVKDWLVGWMKLIYIYIYVHANDKLSWWKVHKIVPFVSDLLVFLGMVPNHMHDAAWRIQRLMHRHRDDALVRTEETILEWALRCRWTFVRLGSWSLQIRQGKFSPWHTPTTSNSWHYCLPLYNIEEPKWDDDGHIIVCNAYHYSSNACVIL
jgi:hypothetical protein